MKKKAARSMPRRAFGQVAPRLEWDTTRLGS